MSESHEVNEHSPLLHRVYTETLRMHAVTLIWMGFQRLDASSYSTAEEDDITGDLVVEMKSVSQDPASPEWVDHYEIHEQVRQNVDNKRGKSRPILDIEIECHRRGPRPRLGFEAKRLSLGNSVGKYLGKDGLSAFLTRHYHTTHGEGGMLGYVQQNTPDEWSEKIAKKISKEKTQYRTSEIDYWQVINDDPMRCCYLSSHTDKSGRGLTIVHILLPFLRSE